MALTKEALLHAVRLAVRRDPCALGLLSRTSSALRGLEGVGQRLGAFDGALGTQQRHAMCWAPAGCSGVRGTGAARQPGVGWRLPAAARALSTESAAEEASQAAPRFVRFFALFMMAAAGFKVAPYVAASSVGHTVGLLEASEPFLIKSGISRMLLLVRASESGRERALAAGAVPRLVRLVGHEDAATVDAALQALDTLAEREEGLEAVRAAGGEAVLQAYLERTRKEEYNEDAVYRAHQLLADLRRPPGAAAAGGGAGGAGGPPAEGQ